MKESRINMMAKPAIVMIIVIIMITMLFSGCSMFSGKNQNYLDVFTGTEGLSMNFVKGMPPDEVYAPEPGKTMPFQAGIELANKGSKDIKGGFLVLSVEKDYLKISSWDIESEATQIGAAGERMLFSIDGRTSINPIPLTRIYTANLEALPIDKQTTHHVSAITLTSCYSYETELSKDVCINTDVYNTKPNEKVCTVGDISVSGGQGAPVEVTKIEEKMVLAGGSAVPQFIIHVRNAGTGSVVDKGKISEACSSSSLGYENYDTIDVDEVKFSGYSSKTGGIECSSNKIKMKNSEGTARCSLKQGNLDTANTMTYTTPLYIKLSYGYTQSISKEVDIKNLQS